jgi:hypothetical protein
MADPDARGHEAFEWLGFRVSGIPPKHIHRTVVQERACETRAGAEMLLGLAAAHGWVGLRIDEIRRKRK